jgi:hypothetical protein
LSPFEIDVMTALEKLRHREFVAGRYRGSEFGPADEDEAFVNMGADGTASILDMLGIGEEHDFCTVAPLTPAELLQYFGTQRPTRAHIEANLEFFEEIESGQGVYIVAYENDQPSELFFGGFSFD